MRTVVCTGMWGTAWERYGREFVETFARHWPAEVELVVYTDRTDFTLPRGDLRQLSDIPGYLEFLARWGDDPVARGRKGGPNAVWKPGYEARGYSWCHDAVKWFPQALIPDDVCRRLGKEYVWVGENEVEPIIVCWLDADVVTRAAVPAEWLNDLIGPSHDCAYLGRVDSHSEIGFWAVRLPAGLDVVEDFAWLYTGHPVRRDPAKFIEQRETHSAFIWDVARAGAWDVRFRNLTPEGSGHVFRSSALAPYLEHFKGALKPA